MAIEYYRTELKNSEVIYTYDINQDSLREYTDYNPLIDLLVAFDIIADGTTLSVSGYQSACVVRVRFVNIRGNSDNCHKVGLSHYLRGRQYYIIAKIAQEISLLTQKFLFFFSRTLLWHQKQYFTLIELKQPSESVLSSAIGNKSEFFSLTVAVSFRYCSIFTIKTRDIVHSEEYLIDNNFIFPNGTYKFIYSRQTKNNSAPFRDISRTVQYHLIVDKHMVGIPGLRQFEGTSVSSVRLQEEKQYLYQSSAAQLPPALAIFYGFCTEPFNTFSFIGCYRLRSCDLGAELYLPEMTFQFFKKPEYKRFTLRKHIFYGSPNKFFQNFLLFAVYALIRSEWTKRSSC